MLVLNHVLRRAVVNLLLETLVRHDDLEQLVCEIVLRALVVILDHRGADLRRRDRHHGTDHPIWPAPEAAETQEIHVLICDSAEEAEDILDLQNLAHLVALHADTAVGIHVLPLGRDTSNAVAGVAVRLEGAAAVLRLLAAAPDITAESKHCAPPGLPPPLHNILPQLLIDEQLAAADTYAVEDIDNVGEELDEVDGTGQTKVAEVAGAVVVRLTTAATGFSVV